MRSQTRPPPQHLVDRQRTLVAGNEQQRQPQQRLSDHTHNRTRSIRRPAKQEATSGNARKRNRKEGRVRTSVHLATEIASEPLHCTILSRAMAAINQHAVARFTCAACFVWMLCFAIFGGMYGGKKAYKELSATIFRTSDSNTVKGGVLLLSLIFPLLMAATTSAVLTVRKRGWGNPSHHQVHQQQSSAASRRPHVVLAIICPACILRMWTRYLHRRSRHSHSDSGSERNMAKQSDPNWNKQTFWFVAVPCAICAAGNIHRHLAGSNDRSMDSKLDHIGNAFGVMALVAGSILFIPVTKHSTFLSLYGWDPISFAAVHVWTGRIVVIGTATHGIFHIMRWVWIAHESLLYMVVPPGPCWKWSSNSGDVDGAAEPFQPTCHDPDTACSCYNLFRNMTGFLAVLCMLALTLTSVGPIRRTSYALFYGCHVVAAPLALIMMILHYNKAVLYFAPGLFYYLVTSVPSWIQSSTRTIFGTSAAPIQIVATKILPSNHGHACVSLKFAATERAWHMYYPGAHIRLHAPGISWISHPFTVNRVEENANTSGMAATSSSANSDDSGEYCSSNANSDDEVATVSEPTNLQIIFRATGPFTKQLLTLCGDSDGSNVHGALTMPRIYIDGFHGGSNRLEQMLAHDVVVMVAGGIGITPYLSLLQEVAKYHHRYHHQQQQEQEPASTAPSRAGNNRLRQRSHKVILHWMCRDVALIKHVQSEYFDSLRKHQDHDDMHGAASRFSIEVHIHNTTSSPSASSNGLGGTDGSQRHGEELPTHDAFLDDPSEEGGDQSKKKASNDIHRNIGNVAVPFEASYFSNAYSSSMSQNIFLIVSFVVTGWIGTWILWHFYIHVQKKDEVSQRIYGITVVGIVSVISSSILYRVAKRTDASSLWMDWNADAYVLGSPDGNLLASAATAEQSIELSPLPSSGNEWNTPHDEDADAEEGQRLDTSATRPCVAITMHTDGRPSLQTLLAEVGTSRDVGVFCCAPAPLMKVMKTYVDAQSNCELYSEAFEV